MTSLPFHLMIKPTGARCNLACSYCYYREKAAYYPGSRLMMDDATLERVTAAYLRAHPPGEVVFGWQGGEPLLAGVDFYRRALRLQAKYRQPKQQVLNALQTNGTLINDEWASFFAQHNFLIGISIDGPAAMHNAYRRMLGGQASYGAVVTGLEKLRRRRVEYNVLTTVHPENQHHPLEVYHHLRELGFRYVQFIPIVEREAPGSRQLTPWSVDPHAYGQFLWAIFAEWAGRDVGKISVQLFDSALSTLVHGHPTLCVFQPTCGRALVVEHSGDLYACDHFVYPEHLRGAVTPETLDALINGDAQGAFGEAKNDLSRQCRLCPVLAFCGGDCPKHRIRPALDGKPISYLCPAYRHFFLHSQPKLAQIASAVK